MDNHFNNNFSKKLRLITKNDFSQLRGKSRFLVSGVFVFYIKPNELNNSRVGIAVSKKLGSAVKRNKIKRLIRESFRNSNFKNKNFDVLVALNFKKISSKKMTFDTICNDVNSSLEGLYSTK